jgi:hypothetical protein
MEAWEVSLIVSGSIVSLIFFIAILMIVAHNYFHGLIPKPGENEMWFSRAFFTMISMIMANPMDFFRPFISFCNGNKNRRIHYGKKTKAPIC